MTGIIQGLLASIGGVPLPAIGAAYEGGFFAGQISATGNGVASHNIVVSPLSSGQDFKQYKNTNTSATGADSNIDGPQNTADMVADGNSTVYPAAHYCNDLSIGSYTDWYMPAKNELEICYYNLKPTTNTNRTNSGINPNAVPARASNYTGGSPATNPSQTSAAAFKSGGAEAFSGQDYWSSTDSANPSAALIQGFYNGYQTTSDKSSTFRVRAIRRVAV